MKRHLVTILTSFLLVSGSASLAFADDQCTTDRDCGESEICVEVTSGCPPPCRPGDDSCVEIECNPGKAKICQPGESEPAASCETDANCEGGLVCVVTTYATCNGGGAEPAPCAPGDTDCNTETEPPEETNCEETTESLCVPPYMAPCTDDASCGAPGFTCEAVPTSCGCTTPAPGGGDEGVEPGIEECDCPAPDESNRYCELAVLPCDVDNDCSDGFICHSNAGPAPGSPCTIDSETGVQTCDEDPVDNSNAEGRCAPADFRDWTGGGPKGEEPTNEGEPGGNTDTGSTPGTGTGDTDPQPAAPGQDDDSAPISGINTDDADGCHVATLNTGKTSTTAILLAGAAAFFTFRRRNKR